jgi:hypothetical protein
MIGMLVAKVCGGWVFYLQAFSEVKVVLLTITFIGWQT